MDYIDYFKKAQLSYNKNRFIDLLKFQFKQLNDIDVDTLSNQVNKYFASDTNSYDKFLIKYNDDIFKLNLDVYLKQFSEFIEQEIYNSYFICNQVVIYRNIHTKNIPESSWLWHYDNYPPSIFKLMIYLTDVNQNSAPFQYVENMLKMSSRIGELNWTSPVNGTRISTKEVNKFVNSGLGKINSVEGSNGTSFVFNNSMLVHRATVPNSGNYRDAVMFQLRPTIKKQAYMSPNYTNSWIWKPNRNPQIL